MKKLMGILLLTVSSIAHATVYYISPTGNDGTGHTGLSGDPWKTLNYACSRVTTAGDIIHVNPGTYVITSQCQLAVGVSIEGEGNTSVIRSQVTDDWSPTISLVSTTVNTKGNQSVSHLRFEGSNMTAWGAIYVGGRGNVRIHHCTFVDFKYTAVIFNGKKAMYEPGEPSVWCSGNEFHDNVVTNCAASFPNNYQAGALHIGAQEEMLIYNNTMTEESRPALQNGYCIKYYNEGYNRGLKIYNNTLKKAPPGNNAMDWNFAIELWFMRGGIEIYNNTIYGGIDLLGGDKRGPYAFQADVHHNIIGYTTLQPLNTSATNGGIYIEEDNTGPIYIHHNLFRNLGTPLQVYPDYGTHVLNIYIYCNVFHGIGTSSSSGGWSTLMQCASSPGGPGGNAIIDNFNFLNNTVYVGAGNADQGLQLPDNGTATNITVRNNIFHGFRYNPVFSDIASGHSIDILSVENNLFYGNGSNTVAHNGRAPTRNTTQNNITGDPKYISSTDLHLQAGSPAIGKGLSIGIETDYDGNAFLSPPSIGAYEYNSSPPPSQKPVYQFSVIEDAAPTVVEMIYHPILANVVPAASAFTVTVNGANRTVQGVAIVAGKVRLTLASQVEYGDVVTVAYTKPATNPLQTSSGAEADNLSPQSVTNNRSPVAPVYSSSVIQDATPNMLEITFSQALANVAPSNSAFTVRVNSVTRGVSAVAIVSGKVRLTLASPVVYGNTVTVAYTRPSTGNRLQSLSGVDVASFAAQPVTNNCAPVIPVYVSSVIENDTPDKLEMTYSQDMANVVPPVSAFTVMVNSTACPVNNITIAVRKVILTLANPVVYGDIVTVAYTRPATGNRLQSTDGVEALSMGPQNVINNCGRDIPILLGAVVEDETPDLLTVSFDRKLANIIPPVSAFEVLINGENSAVRTVRIADNMVLLTLVKAVVYTDLVTLSYNKPGTNALQSENNDEAESFSLYPVTNNCKPAETITLYPNPASGHIIVKLENAKQEPDIIRIVNMSGRIVYESIIEPGLPEYELHFNLHPGVYIIQLCIKDQTYYAASFIITE